MRKTHFFYFSFPNEKLAPNKPLEYKPMQKGLWKKASALKANHPTNNGNFVNNFLLSLHLQVYESISIVFGKKFERGVYYLFLPISGYQLFIWGGGVIQGMCILLVSHSNACLFEGGVCYLFLHKSGRCVLFHMLSMVWLFSFVKILPKFLHLYAEQFSFVSEIMNYLIRNLISPHLVSTTCYWSPKWA